MTEIKKILYSTDFSDCSKEAFPYALSLAAKYEAKIDLIHVVHEPVNITGFVMAHISFDVMEKEMAEVADKKLKAFCDENLKGDVEYAIHIKKGIPFKEITKAAEELGSDIIILGTYGTTGVGHLFFGNTAERVVRTSSIPVLTVKEKIPNAEI